MNMTEPEVTIYGIDDDDLSPLGPGNSSGGYGITAQPMCNLCHMDRPTHSLPMEPEYQTGHNETYGVCLNCFLAHQFQELCEAINHIMVKIDWLVQKEENRQEVTLSEVTTEQQEEEVPVDLEMLSERTQIRNT